MQVVIMTPVLITLIFATVAFTVQVVQAGPSDPEIKPNNTNWLITHERFVNNTLANPTIPILFYGDSITAGWSGQGGGNQGVPVWEEYYAPLNVTNYGIGGDETQHLLWRIINGEVQGLTPKLVVLMAGTNNLGPHDDVGIAGGIATLVATFRQLLPSTKVLLLGILPRNGNTNFGRILNINEMISGLHNGVSVFYLDMFGSFAGPYGTVPETYYFDGLHLTTEGYQKWADVMNPLFNQLIA